MAKPRLKADLDLDVALKPAAPAKGLPGKLQRLAKLYWSGKTAEAERLRRGLRNARLASLPPRDRFQTLIQLGRFEEAFRLGERLLAKAGAAEVQAFSHPWLLGQWESVRDEQLADLRAMRGPAPWTHYYRGLLEKGDAALHELAVAVKTAAPRHQWMLFKAGWAHLYLGRFAEAESLLRAALRARPADPRTRGFLAETLLCRGRGEDAVREMTRALAEAAPGEAGATRAWRGELLLWLGRYAEALRDLEPCRAEGPAWGLCWLGAAELLLGRPRDAERTLDKLLADYPLDREARVWRAEARLALGRPLEALKDLEQAQGLWAHIDRALAWRALEDDERALSCYQEAAAELELPRARDAAEAERRLLALRRRAKGFRRDNYGQAPWMGPSPKR